MAKKDMSVIDHLDEFRNRLIVVVVSFVVFTFVGLIFVTDIYKFIVKDLDFKLAVLGPGDILHIYLMIAAVFGMAVTIPIAAYQIWSFVKPALSKKEQRITLSYIPMFFVLFIAGFSFGYFITLPVIIHFLTSLGNDMFTTMFTTEKYFSFMWGLTLPFAFFFELPLVAVFLTNIGLLNPIILTRVRKYAYLILVIIGSMISPPDFVSHSMSTLPLILIYEFSVSISKIFYKRRMKKRAEVTEVSVREGELPAEETASSEE